MANYAKNSGSDLLAGIANKTGLNLGTSAANSERPRNTNWLNVGIEVMLGEQKYLVTLPLGIAVDSMKVRNISGTSQGSEILRIQQALVEELQKMFSGMAEGERKDLPQLKVQAYKAPSTPREDTRAVDAKALVASIFHSEVPAEQEQAQTQGSDNLPF